MQQCCTNNSYFFFSCVCCMGFDVGRVSRKGRDKQCVFTTIHQYIHLEIVPKNGNSRLIINCEGGMFFWIDERRVKGGEVRSKNDLDIKLRLLLSYFRCVVLHGAVILNNRVMCIIHLYHFIHISTYLHVFVKHSNIYLYMCCFFIYMFTYIYMQLTILSTRTYNVRVIYIMYDYSLNAQALPCTI